MEPEQETKVNIAELKEHVCDIAGDGVQADHHTKATKAIGQYVGRVCGHEMKTLVSQLSESGPAVPVYPKNGDDEQKAIWSKEHDQCVRKREWHADYKSKVFTTIMGQCAKAMKNRVEASEKHDAAENDSDIIVLLGIVKGLAFSASDLKHPAMQAAQAWRNLAVVRQQEDEDVVDCHRRFLSLVEIAEGTHGDMAPVKIAEKDANYAKSKVKVLAAEREKLSAFMFLDGTDKKVFGYLMKNLKNDHTLGNNMCPQTMEDALQV